MPFFEGASNTGAVAPRFVGYDDPGPEIKADVRGFDNNGTTKKTGLKMTKSVAQPVTAKQPNTVPVEAPDPDTFAIDSYRNGGSNASTSFDNDTVSPRTLSASGGDDEISSITLRIPGQSDTNRGTRVSRTGATDNGTDIVKAYSRFFLQSVSESEREKYQIVETFTGYYVFFYGKRPPIYRYTGTLLSDPIYRWNNDFKFVYENYFRGTRATEFGAEVVMQYDGRIITGFALGLDMQQEAMNDKGIPFALDILVVSHTALRFSKDIDSLFARLENDLESARRNMTEYLKALKPSGASSQVSSLATNSLAPPSNISLPTQPFSKLPISQLAP